MIHGKHIIDCIILLTLKKPLVDPQQYAPYLIFVCLARSSAELTGEAILDAVRKAENFSMSTIIRLT
jgi:hypothetical protein